MSHLIEPHGGKLIDLMVTPERREELRAASREIPSWDLTPRQLCDLEILMTGGFSPLTGFMNQKDAESVASNPELARRYPLAFLSPPARNFLNSTFAHLKRFRDLEGEPRLEMHAGDASARGIADGDRVRVFNDRGSFLLRARVNDKPRRGVVVAPSVWWRKYAPDGRNANTVTSQRIADLGGAATFYDCLVEVEKA